MLPKVSLERRPSMQKIPVMNFEANILRAKSINQEQSPEDEYQICDSF